MVYGLSTVQDWKYINKRRLKENPRGSNERMVIRIQRALTLDSSLRADTIAKFDTIFPSLPSLDEITFEDFNCLAKVDLFNVMYKTCVSPLTILFPHIVSLSCETTAFLTFLGKGGYSYFCAGVDDTHRKHGFLTVDIHYMHAAYYCTVLRSFAQ